MSTEKVVIGILAGVVAGALFSYLVAPEKKSTAKKNISSEEAETKDDYQNRYAELLNCLNENK